MAQKNALPSNRQDNDYLVKNIITQVQRHVPQELKDFRNWVLLKMTWDEKKQKWRKMPHQINGRKAKSNDPNTWHSFNEVVQALETGKYQGIAFAFWDDVPYVGIDFDNVKKGDSWKREVLSWIERFDCYTEKSPSGNYHTIIAGQLPDKKTKQVLGDIEIFDRQGFFSFTGDRVIDVSATIQLRQLQLDDMLRMYANKEQKQRHNKACSPTMSDDEILHKLYHADNSNRFKSLFDDGDIRPYDDDKSRADFALAGLISFYTQDPEQIERIMRSSALCRDKWDKHPTYLRDFTIEKAINGLHDVYQFPRKEESVTLEKFQPNLIVDVEPFPTDILPQPLREFIHLASGHGQSVEDFIGVPMLSILGQALGNKVQLKINDRWKAYARVWTAFVGKSGTGKTPAFNNASVPIDHIQRRLDDEYDQKKQQYNLEMEKYEADMKSKKSKKWIQKPVAPIYEQNITNDSTKEALTEVLQFNPNGTLFSADELSSWINQMNEYKKSGSDREFFLYIWNVKDYLINRKGKEPILLRDPFVNITGGIHPDTLENMLASNNKHDGMVERFLVSYPKHKKAYYHETVLPDQVVENYIEVYERLRNMEKKTISFTEDGKKLFVEYHNYLEDEKDEISDSMDSTWSKLKGYTATLALLVHMCRYVCGETKHENVDEISTVYATKLIDYFKTHALKVHNHLKANKEDKRVITLVEKIKEGKILYLRDVIHHSIGGAKNNAQALEIVNLAEEYGYIHKEEYMAGNNRKSYKLYLN